MLNKYWHPHHSGYRNTLIYKHTPSHTLPLSDISLGSLTLYVSEAGDFVELFLLCLSNSFTLSGTLSHYSIPFNYFTTEYEDPIFFKYYNRELLILLQILLLVI